MEVKTALLILDLYKNMNPFRFGQTMAQFERYCAKGLTQMAMKHLQDVHTSLHL